MKNRDVFIFWDFVSVNRQFDCNLLFNREQHSGNPRDNKFVVLRSLSTFSLGCKTIGRLASPWRTVFRQNKMWKVNAKWKTVMALCQEKLVTNQRMFVGFHDSSWQQYDAHFRTLLNIIVLISVTRLKLFCWSVLLLLYGKDICSDWNDADHRL